MSLKSLTTGKNQYDEQFNMSNFKTPEEIGSFSLNINREFEDSNRQLRYFIKPKNPDDVNYDLKKGHDTMEKKEKRSEFKIQHWILRHLDEMPQHQGSKRRFDVDFVCGGGLLSKVLCTPYERFDEWKCGVILYKGTYYLHEMETDSYKQQQTEDREELDWGFKFEQYLTSDRPDGVPDTDAVYNNCEAFYTVVKTKLNSHSLVFAGEIDALVKEDGFNEHYIEIKSTSRIANERMGKTLQLHKWRKWWAQSFITGVKEIACGFRYDEGTDRQGQDKRGVVTRIKYYKTKNLPKKAQKGVRDPWKPRVCFNFLDKFLSFIKSAITTDDHRNIYILERLQGKSVRLNGPLPNGTENNFLSAHFIEKI